jgi:hypothetical protein
MRTCSCGVSTVGFDPRCRAASPSRPSASKRCFYNPIVSRAASDLRGNRRVALAIGQQQDDARSPRRIGTAASRSLMAFQFCSLLDT